MTAIARTDSQFFPRPGDKITRVVESGRRMHVRVHFTFACWVYAGAWFSDLGDAEPESSRLMRMPLVAWMSRSFRNDHE